MEAVVLLLAKVTESSCASRRSVPVLRAEESLSDNVDYSNPLSLSSSLDLRD